MEIGSPDINAYWCYLITLVVGIMVAASKVNALMSSSPGRWGFLQTWLVFSAYTAVPMALFWFLDYTGALHDTSLFSAFVIAFGYRQILTGEMKTITITGEISKLWSPFEAWAAGVRDHIVTVSKRRSDHFEEILRDSLTQTPTNVETLIEVAYARTTDPPSRTKLDSDLRLLNAETRPDDVTPEHFDKYKIRRKVDICLDAIRSAIPETWTFVLRRRNLIDRGKWLGHWQAQTAITTAVCLFALLLITGGFAFRYWVRDSYYRWRFTKVNSTEMDRFRARQYLETRALEMRGAKNGDLKNLVGPLTNVLLYRDLNHTICEEILSMLVGLHDQNAEFIKDLIAALRTEDPDLRLRINRTLTDLRRLNYSEPAKDDQFAAWAPSKDETAGDIEKWVEKYYEWWETKAPGEKAPSRNMAKSSALPSASPDVPSQAGSSH